MLVDDGDGRRTIVIKLKEPLSYALEFCRRAATPAAASLIVPKETDAAFDIRRDMIGTGPYI